MHPLRLVIKPILVAGESNRRQPAPLPWYHDDNQGVFVFSVGGLERDRQFPVVTVNGNILALGLSDTIHIITISPTANTMESRIFIGFIVISFRKKQ